MNMTWVPRTVTFLGVETSDVPRVLSEQMIARGFGVVWTTSCRKALRRSPECSEATSSGCLNDQIIVGQAAWETGPKFRRRHHVNLTSCAKEEI
jgi:hypothetical protein